MLRECDKKGWSQFSARGNYHTLYFGEIMKVTGDKDADKKMANLN